MNLFHTNGYQGTSIEQILAAAQANSGSLYHFFDTKEDLLLAVLDAYLQGLRPIVMDPAFARTADPIDRVFEVLKDYRERVRITDFHYTCPIGSLALEVGEESPRARAKIAENFKQWCAAIEECLDAAGERLPVSLDRSQLSTLVLSVMEGAVMQAKTHRSLDVFDAAVAQLEHYVRGLDRGPRKSKRAARSSGKRRRTK
jgi:TetR/AcrR family transcriptional repressor of nem operon